MTRRLCATLLLVVAGCGGSDGGGDEPPALTASVVEVIQGDGQIDTVGQQLPLAIRVQVMDTAGVGPAAGFAPPEGTPVPVPGQLVNFVVTSGGGTVFAGAAITDTLGRAQELWTLGPSAGAQCLQARAVDQETGEPITFAQVCATAVPGPATKVGFTARSRWVVGDTTIVLPAFAADAFNNIVPVPRPIALDSLVADSTPTGWTVTASRPGLQRFQLGDSVYALRVYPPGGTYTATVTIGDTTWSATGPIRLGPRREITDIGVACGAAGVDSAQTYLKPADSVGVVVREAGGIVDTLTPQAMGTVACTGPRTSPDAGNDVLRAFSLWARDEGLNNVLTVNAAFLGRAGPDWQYSVTAQTFGGAATGSITFAP
jgi:hypothetical protein